MEWETTEKKIGAAADVLERFLYGLSGYGIFSPEEEFVAIEALEKYIASLTIRQRQETRRMITDSIKEGGGIK